MKTGAIHCNPKIAPHLQHNDRTNSTSPNIHKERSHLNECNKSAREALREIDKLYSEAMEKQKGKKGKKTPKERSYHEFIYEISENTTMEQCEKLTEQIAKLTGFTPLQVSIHRDEGHTNGKGEFVTHYHAHAVFFTLDKETGKQLARQQASLNPKNLSKIQDLASETLQMQRGRKYFNLQEYNLSRQEKRAYKPQAPKRIQNQEDFKRFAEAQREAKEYNDKMQETAFKLKNDLDLKEKDLKLKENDLNAKESDLKQKIEKLENTHQSALNNLEQDFKKQYSIIKNIFTFGKHNKMVNESHKIAKSALMTSKSHADGEIEKERKLLKKAKNERDEAEKKVQEMRRQYQELMNENDTLREKLKEQKKLLNEAEQEILKGLDFDKEMQFKRECGQYDPDLSEAQKRALENETNRQAEKAKKQTQLKKQIKSYTRST